LKSRGKLFHFLFFARADLVLETELLWINDKALRRARGGEVQKEHCCQVFKEILPLNHLKIAAPDDHDFAILWMETLAWWNCVKLKKLQQNNFSRLCEATKFRYLLAILVALLLSVIFNYTLKNSVTFEKKSNIFRYLATLRKNAAPLFFISKENKKAECGALNYKKTSPFQIINTIILHKKCVV